MDVAERRSGAVSRWLLCAVSLLLLLMVRSSVQEGESIASYGAVGAELLSVFIAMNSVNCIGCLVRLGSFVC